MPGVDDVEVRTSTIGGAGNGVFANINFAPGDVILSIPRPFVTELHHSRLFDTCAWCCSRGATDPHERSCSQNMGLPAGFVETKACQGCKTVKYCSKICQTKAWKLDHKYECKVLAVPKRPLLPHGVRATIKLLKRLQAGDKVVTELLRFEPLFDEIQKSDPEKYEQYSTLAYGAWKYADEPDGQAGLQVARRLFFAINRNALSLGTPLDDISLGIAFDPLVCTVNHSCDDNALFIFNCPQTMLMARRAIGKGEEIFIKYRDVTNPFLLRRAELKESYFFDCACTKCAKGATTREDRFAKPIEELSPEWCRRADELMKQQAARRINLSWFQVGNNATEAERRMTALQTEGFAPWRAGRQIVNEWPGTLPGTAISDLKASLRVCIDSGMWSLTRQPVPHLLNALFGTYMASGDMDRTLHIGLVKNFVVDPVIAPELFWYEHLSDAWSLCTITTTYSHPRNKEAADRLLRQGCDTRMLFVGLLIEVWENLPKSYGRDSPLGGTVEKVWRTCIGPSGEPSEGLRRQVRDAWPGLKAYAEKIDLLAV